MPTLTNYTAKTPELSVGGRRASETDVYRSNNLGQTITDTAGVVVKVQEEDEARKAVVGSSQIRAQYARDLDAATTSGADLGELKQKMMDDLAKVGDSFVTKKGSESLAIYTANSELMFDEQANRIEATRAAIEARVQGTQFLNSAGQIIQSNPAYLPEAEKNVDALVSTFPKLAPEKKQEISQHLKQELNMAAALANARVDPEGTKKKLEAGAWDLSPEHRNVAINRADTEMRAKRADEAYQRAEDERVKREADDTARDGHFASIMDGKATRRSIMDDADLRPQTREHLINLMEARAKELKTQEKASDPVTKRNLWLGIHAASSDPRKINNGDQIFAAVDKGLLNTADANALNSDLANQRDENNKTIGQHMGYAVSRVGSAIAQDAKYIGRPALVATIQMEYAAQVDAKVAETRKAGGNLNDLFRPDNKDGVVSAGFIQAAINTAESRQREAINAGLPQVNSVEEYNALPADAVYLDTNGNRAVKKGKAVAAPAAAKEREPLPEATLNYYSVLHGIPREEMDPYTGYRKEKPKEPLKPASEKALKFDPMRGGLVTP